MLRNVCFTFCRTSLFNYCQIISQAKFLSFQSIERTKGRNFVCISGIGRGKKFQKNDAMIMGGPQKYHFSKVVYNSLQSSSTEFFGPKTNFFFFKTFFLLFYFFVQNIKKKSPGKCYKNVFIISLLVVDGFLFIVLLVLTSLLPPITSSTTIP